MNLFIPSFSDFLAKQIKIYRTLLISQIVVIGLSFMFPEQQVVFEGGIFIFPIFLAIAFSALYFQQKNAVKKAKQLTDLLCYSRWCSIL